MREVDVRVKGPGGGRESAIRAIAQAMKMVDVKRVDAASQPHRVCHKKLA